MKAAAFDYHRPESLAEALQLAGSFDNAKFLAGGQSLVAMLNMRYAIVDDLIDLNRVPGLDGISIDGATLRVGAMTRQKAIKAHDALASRSPVFAAGLDYVGHLQTRNRGTLGGSLCHLDPAAELVSLAFLHDAVVTVASDANGVREIPIADFPLAYMTPSIAPDEMVTEVRFALPAPGHGWGFHEFAQRHGDFALAGAAALVEMTEGRVARAAISIFGGGMSPVRVTGAEDLLAGQAPSDDGLRAAAAMVDGLDYSTDAMASGAYRRRLTGVLTRRALADAVRRCREVS